LHLFPTRIRHYFAVAVGQELLQSLLLSIGSAIGLLIEPFSDLLHLSFELLFGQPLPLSL
jgi:hypothetical protein